MEISRMMIDRWLPIKGYEDLYQVNGCGLVRSLERTVEGGRWGKPYKRKRKVLARTLHKNKFYRVSLRKNGKNKKFFLGRLVAEAFVPNPENKKQIRYINGDTKDNRSTNLKWI